MEIGSEGLRVEEALRQGLAVGRVTRAWPKGLEQLPCVVIRELENRPVDFRDDRPYLVELVLELQVFARRVSEKEGLCQAAEDVMAGLGYIRVAALDGEERELRARILRYRRVARAKGAWAG